MGTARLKTYRGFEDAIYRKVSLRLVPFLILCYAVAYLDRANVAFAKLQMLSDLKFSETVYGFGSGIFFIGYFFFEVPSNLMLHKFGARLWIARIMFSWGIISAGTMLVTTPLQFYIVRFLLGVAEAGFFPGIILYLTYWYPAHRRAQMVATFMIAIPFSQVLGAPFSGFIMQYFSGVHGWPGWKWLFLLEAVPALIMGFATVLYLDRGIRTAKWLTEAEKELLEQNIAHDGKEKVEHPSLGALFADQRIWLMAWIQFTCVMAGYGLTFWMPTLVREAGIQSVLNVGLITAIPYIVTAITMILLGRSADRSRERRWHLAIPMVVGGAALVGSVVAGPREVLAILFLSIAAAGVISSSSLFWSLPTAFLSGTAAAAGIAAINSVGNLAGFVSPSILGRLKDLTHSNAAGLYVLALVLVMGAATVLSVPARLVNK